ncbi:hypothetical protein GCM10025883_01400 [Mobilicoccus caccae]|uniref:Uncharacterized protein n=1 Tax=Mobilicoccus caccae TaxID=1859295 RepID=A0ABQ6IJJ8_9MICO|nr:hypothetical protein GCM10025883_01400 [Mobilicoccus caccae]
MPVRHPTAAPDGRVGRVSHVDQHGGGGGASARLGISRAEFLRRTVEREAHLGSAPVAASDFDKFASLGDDDLMRDAWS